MNKKVTRVVAATVGTAMFAGMLVSGVGASAKQVEAHNVSTAGGLANLMGVLTDNATNVQVFKTDYGYGAWATDSNGNIIGDEPVAKTAYYIPMVGVKGRDTDYGDFVAAYEVDLSYQNQWGFTGNTVQTYYDVADFATNIPDYYNHTANGLPIFSNDYTSSASFDKNGGTTSPYIFGFEFGDYNDKYVEFVGTTWNVKNYNNKDKAFVDNTQIGVWTDDDLKKKYPDFTAGRDLSWDSDGDGKKDTYIPEVYANPVFEDAWSFAWSDSFDIPYADAENILVGYDWNRNVDLPGQIMPPADNNGCFWGDITDNGWGPDHLGDYNWGFGR